MDAYLARLGYRGARTATFDTLHALQRQHLLTVPFENLDILLKRPITLDFDSWYIKIVTNKRGGFCYELNGLFAALLSSLGFTVNYLSARVWTGSDFGPEFDHMVLLAAVQEAWLVDVGFGDSSLMPLRFAPGDAQYDGQRAYRLIEGGDAWIMQECDRDTGEWVHGYTFTLKPRRLSEFDSMCRKQQMSPESHFTRKLICSRATAQGRVTLSNERLITRTGGQRQESMLAGAISMQEALEQHFGVALTVDEVRAIIEAVGLQFGASP